MSGEEEISQDEIETLLDASADTGAMPAAEQAISDQASIDSLLDGSEAEKASPQQGRAKPFQLPSFKDGGIATEEMAIDLLKDVDLEVKVVLGRNELFVADILKLKEGSVVELDKLAGDPLDILVNDRIVARGEVLVLNNNFCIRVTEIVDQSTLGSGK